MGVEKVTFHVCWQIQPPSILSHTALEALRTDDYLKKYICDFLCLNNTKLIR